MRSSTITCDTIVSNCYQVGALAPLIYQVHLIIIASMVHFSNGSSFVLLWIPIIIKRIGQELKAAEKEQLFVLTDKAAGEDYLHAERRGNYH